MPEKRAPNEHISRDPNQDCNWRHVDLKGHYKVSERNRSSHLCDTEFTPQNILVSAHNYLAFNNDKYSHLYVKI